MRYIIMYYDGNEDHIIAVEAGDMFAACEKLGDSGKCNDIPWEESVRHVLIPYVGGTEDAPYMMAKIFNNNPGAGEEVSYEDIEVLT